MDTRPLESPREGAIPPPVAEVDGTDIGALFVAGATPGKPNDGTVNDGGATCAGGADGGGVGVGVGGVGGGGLTDPLVCSPVTEPLA